MKNDITSEEKLLNLIRQKPAAAKSAVEPASVPKTVKRTSIPRRRAVDLLTMGFRSLIIAALGLSVYLFLTVFVLKDERPAVTRPASDDVKVTSQPEPLVSLTNQPFEPYAEVLQKRDIFSPSAAKVVPAGTETLGEETAAPIDISQDFKLVGILLDKNPQAVFEDIRKNETVFLSAGDALGDGKVVEIKAGKVVVSFRGQKQELTP